MHLPVEMKNFLCRIDQSSNGSIIMLLCGFVVFSLFNKFYNIISEEEKPRNIRKSFKYLNKYQKENEEFFNVAEETDASTN